MDELEKTLIDNALDTYVSMWNMKNEVQKEEAEIDGLMAILAATTALQLGFSEKAVADSFINEQIRIIMCKTELSKEERIEKLKEMYEGLKPEWR